MNSIIQLPNDYYIVASEIIYISDIKYDVKSAEYEVFFNIKLKNDPNLLEISEHYSIKEYSLEDAKRLFEIKRNNVLDYWKVNERTKK